MRQCVVARRPSSRPAAASAKAPEHTLVMRRECAAAARTKAISRGENASSRGPLPPEMTNVSKAGSSRPCVCMTRPGALCTCAPPSDSTSIRYAGCGASRFATSKAVNGPVKSSRLQPGNTRKPILRMMS
ncbi:hypothetical protein DL770_011253 [Monosporascus sp. CRB-9-2]|nr:hypothetical protein DL770_011253 [Monosporascus sp. CRB-9-2]